MNQKLNRRDAKDRCGRISPGWLFISPWLAGFCLFTLIPFLASFYLSFCRYDVLAAPEWVGLHNFLNLLFHDPLFWKSLWNTVIYAVVALPLGIAAGVGLALLLSMDIRGIAVYRTLCYVPAIVPLVASCVLWNWILNPQIGLINGLLGMAGVEGPLWLSSTVWSKPALILMSLWSAGGTMIIYLAGLKDIPFTVYEAAALDGATVWQRTIHITLPMLTPVIFFNLVMGLIGAFQYFTQAYIMTRGGPADSTLFYSLYLFDRAFTYLDMGYASAMAWILFAIVMVCTLLVLRTHKAWVHYGE